MLTPLGIECANAPIGAYVYDSQGVEDTLTRANAHASRFDNKEDQENEGGGGGEARAIGALSLAQFHSYCPNPRVER